jgi:hypothetical protein
MNERNEWTLPSLFMDTTSNGKRLILCLYLISRMTRAAGVGGWGWFRNLQTLGLRIRQCIAPSAPYRILPAEHFTKLHIVYVYFIAESAESKVLFDYACHP